MNNFGNTRPDNTAGALLINRSGWGGILMRASIRPARHPAGILQTEGFQSWTNIPRRSAYQPRTPVIGPRMDYGTLTGAPIIITNG
jgi:hypothetical protein